MPDLAMVQELFEKGLKLLEKKQKNQVFNFPVVSGIFPIAAISFDPGEPSEIFITGSVVISVIIEDRFFWEAIKKWLTFEAGDALIAELRWDPELEIMKAVKVKGIFNLRTRELKVLR